MMSEIQALYDMGYRHFISGGTLSKDIFAAYDGLPGGTAHGPVNWPGATTCPS